MQDGTLIVHAGREPERYSGLVNPLVYHASTILYPTMEAYSQRAVGDLKYRSVRYGAYGVPTTFALADAVAALEGGQGAVVVSSGLAAVTLALTAFVGQGDPLLMVDSAYGPTREFCNTGLKRFGVDTTYYDPLSGGQIADLIQANTRLVFTESPGSLTFEVQDLPAIAAAAHQRDVLVLLDNTWGTPLFFKPFTHGIDISIQAGTKNTSRGIRTSSSASLRRAPRRCSAASRTPPSHRGPLDRDGLRAPLPCGARRSSGSDRRSGRRVQALTSSAGEKRLDYWAGSEKKAEHPWRRVDA